MAIGRRAILEVGVGSVTAKARKRAQVFFAWPTRDGLAAYVRFLLVFSLLFFPVYAGAGWLTARSGRAYAMFFEWERSIPFVPAMIAPYFALYPLFLPPLFRLTSADFSCLVRQTALVLAVAFVAFLLVPGRSGFPPVEAAGPLTRALVLLRSVDAPHNLVPSLHVTFSALILAACAAGAPAGPRLACFGGLAVMCASTLLTHQHHVIDVAAGLLLAFAARSLFRAA